MTKTLKTIIGMFIPVKWENGKWGGTIDVAGIPLGLWMIAMAVAVNLIMK